MLNLSEIDKSKKSKEGKEEKAEVTEFKAKLIKSEDYTKMTNLYIKEKKANLTKDDLASIFKNLQFTTENKVAALNEFIFGDKDKIRIRIFL